MRRAKKGLAILASTVLLVTSAVNYHGLTFSTNVYSEETSNAETVSESELESITTETQTEIPAAEAQIEAMPVNVEVPETVPSETTVPEAVVSEVVASESGLDVVAENKTVAPESESSLAETTSVPEQTETVASVVEESETEATVESASLEATSEELEDASMSEKITEETEAEEESTEFETEAGTEEESTEIENEIAVMSLLPLEEVTAYLLIENKTEDELKNMTIDEVLNSLQDSNGDKISVSESATTAWRYVKDETDGVEQYVKYSLGQGAKIDLSSTDEKITKYKMELIVGSEDQLDRENKRYLITVYLSKALFEKLTYELYKQDESGVRTKITPTRLNEISASSSAKAVFVELPNHIEGTEYYLGIHSEIADHPYIQVDIYTNAEWEKKKAGMDASPCTDKILNQNMTKINSGVKGVYDFSSTTTEEELKQRSFHVVWTDTEKGNVLDSIDLSYCILSDMTSIEGRLLAYDAQNNNMNRATCVEYLSLKQIFKQDSHIEVGGVSIPIGRTFDVTMYNYMLKKEYLSSDELYFAMVDPGIEIENGLLKVVEGLYESLDEASDQPDIKDQFFISNFSQAPVGWKANYKDGKYFTLFWGSGRVNNIGVRIADYDSKLDFSYVKSFTTAPSIGEADPWFRVTGVKQNNIDVPSFIVQNGSNMNLDTMYGYGYQTVLIQNEDVDLSQLQPEFWIADPEHVTEVRVNGQLVQSGDVIDCSNTVAFTVVIDGKQKEYQVNFVKSSPEAKLFVAGPQTHEVFLDEYTEYKHDILIANLGQKELTGLRVELNATNCKLDDYWTVGGENNGTLAPFDSTTTDTEYGVLGNLAKVRLLPLNDEGGEIEGTLTVYADGQEPIVINLTGRAQNPKIVTDQEKFDKVTAVKYVPYSYMISTNNMYDWTDVTYTLTGDLPDGVDWYPETGEIYGTPQESGTFPITVEASFTSDTYTFESSKVDLVLTVYENTPENVYNASSEDYGIKQALGTDIGDYNFVLTSLDDAEFVSYGEIAEFEAVWLNGKKLTEGEDYDAERGSTRITIHGETFENTDYVNQDGDNTIAMEFRKDGNKNEELKRTSQNFTINLTKPTEPEPTQPTTVEPTKPTVAPTQPTTAEPTKPTTAPTKPTAEPTKPTVAPTTPTTKPTTAPTTAESTTAKATTSETTKEESTTAKPSETSTAAGSSTGTTADHTETKKPDETKSTQASEETPETAATAKENETTGSLAATTEASVTCTVKMVDADNKAIDNLNLELRSTPQNALTDTNGCAAFASIEFGAHTLSVKSADGATEASVSFTVTEGNTLGLAGNVITAPSGADFILTVRYNQGNLELVSVHDNAARSFEIILGVEDYAEWIGAFLLGIGIAMFMCLCAYAVNSAVRRRK